VVNNFVNVIYMRSFPGDYLSAFLAGWKIIAILIMDYFTVLIDKTIGHS